MTVSGLAYTDVVRYLHIDPVDVTAAEQVLLTAYLDAAKSYAKDYTGQDIEALDEIGDVMAVAVLCLAADMYTNRDMVTGGTKGTVNTNKTVESILNMHAVNLVPKAPDAGVATEEPTGKGWIN